MPNRILFLVSAVLASLALPVIPNVAHAADDCLASPDQATPSGGHWRYHIERGTGRKCWYLAGETAASDQTKAGQTKPDDAAADDGRSASDDADTTASVPPRPAAKIRPSLERAAAAPDRPRPSRPAAQPAEPAPANNARAEFIDKPSGDQPAPTAQTQPDAPQSSLPPVVAPGSVATRWPSPVGIVASDSNAPLAAAATAAPASAPQPAAEPQPAVSTDQTAATPVASADQAATQPAGTARGPDYLLLALIIATVGFVAVVGFAAVRFVADWWRDWREEHRWRRSIPSYTAARGRRSMLAMDDVPMGLAPANDAATPRPRGQRVIVEEEPPRRLEDEIDEIEQLLELTRGVDHQQRNAAALEPEMPRDAAE